MATVIAEYIWLDSNKRFRSKARTLENHTGNKSEYFPDWTYDGSSTNQADGTDSEIILHPVAVYTCPFRTKTKFEGIYYRIVLCETYHRNGDLTKVNTRYNANKVFLGLKKHIPWYGLEQEYFIINPQTGKPLGWPADDSVPEKQGKYYCGVGTGKIFGRDLVDTHYEYCLYAGLNISGINAEVAPGQWEFQIGPCEGISAGDQLWVARYILERLAEEFEVEISYDPKPIEGNWNGSGCHTNFSTEFMREGNNSTTGLDYINDAVTKLSHKHLEHMNVYGDGNERRMTGEHETSSYDVFSSDVANRECSIRIPAQTAKEGKGYFEDRRPSSNCDPYLVTSKILLTVCGFENVEKLEQSLVE
jgi:glutamine synthetase